MNGLPRRGGPFDLWKVVIRWPNTRPAIYVAMTVFIDVVLLRRKPRLTWPWLIVVLLGIPVYYAWSQQKNSKGTL